MLKAIPLFLILGLSACTSMKVVKTNSDSGYFSTGKKANVTKSIDYDLDSVKDLILVPSSEFTPQMVENIGYFNEIINIEDLQRIIVANDLTDEVPSISDRIGLNKAAKAYKQFLWLRWDRRTENNKSYMQLILTDPKTLEDIFICETHLDYIWKGVNDQSNWYPMMNSLIDYIKANSQSFGR